MARIWKEALDLDRHRDFMSGAQDAGGAPVDRNRSDGWVYFVREGGFTFQFVNLDQLREALAYFSETVHRPNMIAGISLEHYWQRWFERLPPGLTGGSKRISIKKALTRALVEFAPARAG
jgi:hypothetical protein